MHRTGQTGPAALFDAELDISGMRAVEFEAITVGRHVDPEREAVAQGHRARELAGEKVERRRLGRAGPLVAEEIEKVASLMAFTPR